MTDFLLELRSEEIPARMQEKARADLASLFAARLEALNLDHEGIESYATPRRLALIVRGVADATTAMTEERKGPRADAPAQAIEGFLRSTGLTRDQLVERDDAKGGKLLFAVIERPGMPAPSVLSNACQHVIHAFPWPKSMRWGEASASTESLRWVRPLQGIVALFGDALVQFEVAGVKSGVTTVGHRFHHPGPITIGSAADYIEKLRACHVIVDGAERRAIIAVGAKMAAGKAGLALIEDEGLLYENAGLTEWPVPLLGRFDADFLSVPPEVIQLTARVNQKYFVCSGADGKLANAFICTANIDALDGGAKIVEGNQKVLAARLSDARFFYETDLKTRLEDLQPKLEKIVFHEKLGTVADKVERVAKLARWLVTENIVTPAKAGGQSQAGQSPETLGPGLRRDDEEVAKLADQAERAARLAKADLVTGMVGEFPELQGLMGGYYAAAQGEDPAVAEAIRDHYKPVGQGDDVPTAPVTVAVSLADKLDTLVGFFLSDERPTGSKDPFALRRATLAVEILTIVSGLRYHLESPIAFGTKRYFDQADQRVRSELKPDSKLEFSGTPWKKLIAVDPDDDPEDPPVEIGGSFFVNYWLRYSANRALVAGVPGLLDFFADRLKVQQREAGVRHDLIDAVFALGGEDDLVRLLARVHALQAFVTTEDGANLLAGYKRAANILKKEGFDGTDAGTGANIYAAEPAESTLIEALNAAEPRAAAAIEAEDFAGAMAALSTLRAPIDAFFDQVTVNDADQTKRAARLALLARMRDAVHRVADFSKIEG
ncbi:glycine--tRNA ligase subunit beta [Sphingomonas sp. LB-2]|uniref:glycine--tRNA ligase subunit beta n=1 Tax=Sphingomonas caeni TaxID=2984949 RepID=UPI00223224C0|nr:glycine--tRNA ligase subunit beta [Sphingomonas caeni]MCW3848948.1 glycine--tRNA ligase subunit beta [Sphingomonas caeni]